LLNALCGRASYARVQGDVQFENRSLTRYDLDYVPQFDEPNEFFSIRESLMYAGRLKKRVDDHHKWVFCHSA